MLELVVGGCTRNFRAVGDRLHRGGLLQQLHDVPDALTPTRTLRLRIPT